MTSQNFDKRFLLLYLGLILMVYSCSSSNSRQLEGTSWILTSSEVDILDLPGKCSHLKKGAIFKFSDGSLAVSPISGYACKNYAYQLSDSAGAMSIFFEDMVYEYEILELTDESLKIKSHFLSEEYMINWREEYLEWKSDGYLIDLTRLE